MVERDLGKMNMHTNKILGVCTRNEFDAIAHTERLQTWTQSLPKPNPMVDATILLNWVSTRTEGQTMTRWAKIGSSLLERMQLERGTYSTTSHPSNQEFKA